MNIITEPNVHVLSVPQFFPHPAYEVPDCDELQSECSKNIHSLIAHAGKGCYDSYGKDGRSIDKHIQSLISSGHGSVLEHANISLFITGISRGCSHEIVRHRHFNYSQRSTRYTSEEDAAIVLDPLYAYFYNNHSQDTNIPDCECAGCVALTDFIHGCVAGFDAYEQALENLGSLSKPNPNMTAHEFRKYKRGKARQLLPHALETRMTMTGNLRAWRHFIEARSSRHAEAEIRRLSNAIYDKLEPLAPLVFQDYIGQYIDGYYEYTTDHTKI